MLKKMNPNLRKIIANTTWLFGEKILQLFLGLFVGVWVARYLGPENFGLYNYVIAIVSLFGVIANLGLDQIIVRDISRDISQKDETLGTSFILRFTASIFSTFAVILFTFISDNNDPQVRMLIGIFSLAMSCSRSMEIVEYWFQSQVQSKYVVVGKNIVYITINIIKVIAIQLQAPVSVFVLILSLEQILNAIGLVIVYQFSGSLIKAWRFSYNRVRSLLKDSWPLILANIVIIIYMRIDQIMLAQISGAASVGLYSAAVKISEMWYFVPISIINSVYPSVVQGKELGDRIYYGRIQKLFGVVAIIGYLVAIPVTFLSPFIVTLIYGTEYAESATVLTIHIWAGLFIGLGVARTTWLTTENLTQFAAATTALGALVNIILNSLWIETYGGTGAAVATVISQIAASYLSGLFFPPTRPIFWRQTKAILLISWLER
ncbi:MAG: flippase [Cyanobacteria bacterium SBLK]|nr:flippase [Cyanobacteria bacterium SBLK]